MERVNSQFKELLPLFQMVNEFERSKLVEVTTKIRNIQAKLVDLNNRSNEITFEEMLPNSNWINWIAKERILENQKLAKALVEFETQKKCLAVAAGRVEVLSKLVG